jgi:hypothetical protein
MSLSSSKAQEKALEYARKLYPEVDPAGWELVEFTQKTDAQQVAEEITLQGVVASEPRHYWHAVLKGSPGTRVVIELALEDCRVQKASRL